MGMRFHVMEVLMVILLRAVGGLGSLFCME